MDRAVWLRGVSVGMLGALGACAGPAADPDASEPPAEAPASTATEGFTLDAGTTPLDAGVVPGCPLCSTFITTGATSPRTSVTAVAIGQAGGVPTIVGLASPGATLGTTSIPVAPNFYSGYVASLDLDAKVRWLTTSPWTRLDDVAVTSFGWSVAVGAKPLPMAVNGHVGTILAYDSVGALRWQRDISSAESMIRKVVAVSNGELIVAGTYDHALTFGTRSLPAPPTSYEGAFVAKLDSTGNVTSLVTALTAAEIDLAALAFDPMTGTVALAGNFSQTGTFRGGTTRVSAGYADIFVLALDSLLSSRWVEIVGGVDHDVAHGLAIDDFGRPWLAAKTSGSVTLSNGTATSGPLLARLRANGGFDRIVPVGGWLEFSSLAVKTSGVVVTGHFSETMTIGGVTRTAPLTSQDNVFLAEVNNSATALAIASYGGTGNEYGQDLALDRRSNQAWVSGSFYDSFRWTGLASVTINGSAGFVARATLSQLAVDPPPPPIFN